MRERQRIFRGLQNMQFTLRGLRRQVAGHAAALAGIVALFAFIGPFGTYDSMGPLGRTGYWLLAMSGNWSIWAGSALLTLHLTHDWPLRRRAAWRWRWRRYWRPCPARRSSSPPKRCSGRAMSAWRGYRRSIWGSR